jgi:4-hydroxybenzoate polyprenyltransferase
VEDHPITFGGWLLAFSSIIALRLLGESFLSSFSGKSPDFFIGSSLAAWLFFLFAALILVMILGVYLRIGYRKIANILLWGFIMVIFPPLIDRSLCGPDYWSFYLFDGLSGLFSKFLLFFGDSPCLGITYGVRFEVAFAAILVGVYAFIKTKKPIRSLFAVILTYSTLFILGSLPWLAAMLLLLPKNIFSVQSYDIAGVFLSTTGFLSIRDISILNALNVKMNLIYAFFISILSMLFFWKYFQRTFIEIAKNIRWVQILIHSGLVLFGITLGAFYFPQNITLNAFSFLAAANLILSATFSWIASVFLNDIADKSIDEMTNTNRPLVSGQADIEDYKDIFWPFFILALALGLSVGTKFFFLALIYQIIGVIYSIFPYRLKRFPIIATFLSALAITLWFFAGFMLLSDNQQIDQLPRQIIALMLVAFTISLPVKDLKDIEGDKKNGVWTVPVIFGEKWARFIIGLGIFISYSLSVLWLNAKILFFPAMLCGLFSFIVLQSEKISSRRVHVWVFAAIFFYTACIFFFLFLPILAAKLKLG